ncbi:hypothetical protein Hdeb2414_s0006g00202891 [Helianthus debilis subsp. tardiflorus]
MDVWVKRRIEVLIPSSNLMEGVGLQILSGSRASRGQDLMPVEELTLDIDSK